MSITMTATAAKAKLLGLLDDVAEGQEVQITRHGRVVARLVPAVGPHALRGSTSGLASTSGAEEDLFGTDEDWNIG